MIQVDLIIVVPVVLAALSAVAGRRFSSAGKWLALAAPLVQAGLMVSLAANGLFDGAHVQGVSTGSIWATGADGLSTPLVALTVAVGLLAVSASWRVKDRAGTHFALLAFLQGAVAAVFLAENLILFYIAWESVLVPMFLLIGGWGSANARRAAMKFLVFTFAGGAVLLAGVIMTLVVAGTNSIPVLVASGRENAAQPLLFWLLAIGFMVKVPAVGLHTWLPDAHTEAPTAGSIILAGVLLKMGGYGLIRIAGPFAPQGFESGGWVLVVLGIVGIIWGAATALVQSDLKRLIAYSSVAHMGFVLLAVGVGTPAALGAALMTMMSHGLVAGLLFYLVGALYERTHTRELGHFGGLGDITPRWSTAFVFAALASAGLPGLSGFPGEFVAFIEGFRAHGWWMIVTGMGVVLAAAYNLRAIRSTVQGEFAHSPEVPDLRAGETWAAVLTGAAVVVLGLAPWLVTRPASEVLTSIAVLIGRGGL